MDTMGWNIKKNIRVPNGRITLIVAVYLLIKCS